MIMGLLSVSAAFAGNSRFDPVDGPHVDLKLSLDQDALRMQATMNIVFLDEALDFDRELPDRIDPAEGPALLEALQLWADTALVAEIDGVDDAARERQRRAHATTL